MLIWRLSVAVHIGKHALWPVINVGWFNIDDLEPDRQIYTPNFPAIRYSTLHTQVPELRTKLGEWGLETKGTKAELIARVDSYLKEQGGCGQWVWLVT